MKVRLLKKARKKAPTLRVIEVKDEKRDIPFIVQSNVFEEWSEVFRFDTKERAIEICKEAQRDNILRYARNSFQREVKVIWP